MKNIKRTSKKFWNIFWKFFRQHQVQTKVSREKNFFFSKLVNSGGELPQNRAKRKRNRGIHAYERTHMSQKTN